MVDERCSGQESSQGHSPRNYLWPLPPVVWLLELGVYGSKSSAPMKEGWGHASSSLCGEHSLSPAGLWLWDHFLLLHSEAGSGPAEPSGTAGADA